MRTIILLLCLSIATACSKTDEQEQLSSHLIFKSSQEPALTRTGGINLEEAGGGGQNVFTGDDILWFNTSTRELRFKNNISQKEIIAALLSRSIMFYIDDEYLFTTMTCVSDLNSQTCDSPVFYYSQIENRFYLKDGYPDIAFLQNSAAHQSLRNENTEKIRYEWDKFINQLRIEGKLL
jgi:hypothetical protein